MNADEKLTLMDWCRNAQALSMLTTRNRPLKLVGNHDGPGLRAIWRPIPIASSSYSLCAEVERNGDLTSVTFRNLQTDASLELTSDRSARRLVAFSQVARSLLN